MAAKKKGDFKGLLEQIHSKSFRPIYLLQGEESWFIDQLDEAFRTQVLEEHERDFNQTILYGKDSSFEQIINAAKRFPMMAERQLIIVREAQDLDDWRREDARDQMEAYAKNPQLTTVLVFAHKYKSLAANTKVYKAIAAAGEVFDAVKLNESALRDWIVATAKSMELNLAPEVVNIVGEYLGSDLDKVMHALEKLKLMVGDAVVSGADIEKYIGISKDYNVFELQEAIAARDHKRAQRIAMYFAANPRNNNINLVIGFLHSFWSKLLIYHRLKDRSNSALGRALHIPFTAYDTFQRAGANYSLQEVVRNIDVLRSTDRMLKGRVYTSTSEEDLYRQLVLDLMI